MPPDGREPLACLALPRLVDPTLQDSEGRCQNVVLIRTAELSDVAQYAYAAAARADARLIFLAGACPLNLDGSTAEVGDYPAQASKAMENLVIALKAAGAQLDDVLSTRVLVASSNQSDLNKAWALVREAFGTHDVPSTLLGVTVLGYTDQLVEIEAVAASSTVVTEPALSMFSRSTASATWSSCP